MKTARNTRQKIIEAAAELFVRHGFAAVSMDAIADAAGFTKMTLYQYVDSKEDLLLVCLRWRLEKRERHLDAHFAGRRASAGTVLEIFRWMSLKRGEGPFHGCAFIKAATETAASIPAVRAIALDAKRLLRARIVALLGQAGIPDPDGRGEAISLLAEGALALSLLEQSARPFRAARRAAAAWILPRGDVRGTGPSLAHGVPL